MTFLPEERLMPSWFSLVLFTSFNDYKDNDNDDRMQTNTPNFFDQTNVEKV